MIGTVFAQLASAGDWVRAHPDDAAKLLAPIWGLDAATALRWNFCTRRAEAASVSASASTSASTN